MGLLNWIFGHRRAIETGWIEPFKTTEAEVNARLGRPSKVLKGDDFLSHKGDFFADTLVYSRRLKIDVNSNDRLVRRVVVGGVACEGYTIAGGYLQGAR